MIEISSKAYKQFCKLMDDGRREMEALHEVADDWDLTDEQASDLHELWLRNAEFRNGDDEDDD